MKFLPARLLIYRVNCQWKFIGDCWGSDYSSFSPGVEVSSFTDATCLLRLDDCREAELASLLSVPLILFPLCLRRKGENPSHFQVRQSHSDRKLSDSKNHSV